MTVRSRQEVDEVLVSKGEAYIGPPFEQSNIPESMEKSGRWAFPRAREDVSGPG